MYRCYLFDIDGTIADLSHRLHHIRPPLLADGSYGPKNWNAFFAECGGDRPVPHIWELLNDLCGVGVTIIYVSGRSDRVRLETEAWIKTHGFPMVTHRNRLYMRKDGDHRPDHLVKAELLDQIIAAGYSPIMAFDDRDQVVKMWRERGVPCAQVADGNF
jgi:phosphoglycolate phosphatase-like HAD superfamily hydrolase